MESDASFLSIGVALTLIVVGVLAVWFLEQLRGRYTTVPHIPESFIFLFLGALTASLLQVGALNGHISAVVTSLDTSFGDVVMKLLLPPVIMHSAMDLGRGAGAVELNVLARYVYPGLTLAGLGTLISAFLTGLVMYVAGLVGGGPTADFPVALLLGVCVSASDTPAVLSLFETIQPGAEAFSIIYIESMFNDAVAIVAFHTIATFVDNPQASGVWSALTACGAFLGVFLGSLALGGLVGWLTVQLFKTCRWSGGVEGDGLPRGVTSFPATTAAAAAAAPPNSTSASSSSSTTGRGGAGSTLDTPSFSLPPTTFAPPPPPHHQQGLTSAEQVEVTLLSLTGLVAYMTGEGAGMSGVVACLACGVILGRWALPLVSPGSRAFTLGLLKLIAHLCDRGVFLGLGVALPQLAGLGTHWGGALVLVGACFFSRAAAVTACAALVNYRAPPSRPRTSHRARGIVGWAGTLRGGVCFALASLGQRVVNQAGKDDGVGGGNTFLVTTLFVVLVTLVTVTGSLKRVVSWYPPPYAELKGEEGEGEGDLGDMGDLGGGMELGGRGGGGSISGKFSLRGGGSSGGMGAGSGSGGSGRVPSFPSESETLEETAKEEEETMMASFAELLGKKQLKQQQQQHGGGSGNSSSLRVEGEKEGNGGGSREAGGGRGRSSSFSSSAANAMSFVASSLRTGVGRGKPHAATLPPREGGGGRYSGSRGGGVEQQLPPLPSNSNNPIASRISSSTRNFFANVKAAIAPPPSS